MQHITKAIILAGGIELTLLPEFESIPKPLLPVGNLPLIYYSISNLAKNGVKEIYITCKSQDERAFRESLAFMEKGVSIHYVPESVPKGTAGAIYQVAKDFNDDAFWVLQGGMIIDLDLMKIAGFHQKENAMVTIVAQRANLPTEGISCNPDGEVEKIYLFHKSRDRRRAYTPSGIYLLNCEVLNYVDPSGYCDLKEQLIPRLREGGLSVRIFESNGDGYIHQIRSMSDYCSTNLEVVESGMVNGYKNDNNYSRNGALVGRESKIAPSAHIIGPVVIGDTVTIGTDCLIVGPAIIGDRVVIGDGSLFRESIALADTVIPEKSKIEYSLWTRNGETFSFKKNGNGNSNHPDDHDDDQWNSFNSNGKSYYNFLKRLIDICLSAGGLILLSPFFLLIAILIYIDSPGPIYYTQRRCGINGREFPMAKFRTMVHNADKLQKQFVMQKDVDGPVFKMKDDPRVTRVGRVLRRISLDELPQLWNVLKGEMSLVGPRPLVMEEMRLNPKWRDLRLRVKPGMTGLWQVSGGSGAPFYKWLEMDLQYLKRRSVLFDIIIILKTIMFVLRQIKNYFANNLYGQTQS